MLPVELVMMEGEVPFAFLVAQTITAEEVSPERVLDIWEFGRSLGGGQVLPFYLTRCWDPQPRVGTRCSVSLADVFVKICIFMIFVGYSLRAFRRWYL